MARTRPVGRTFLELADTLVSNYDVNEFLELLSRRSREILDAEASGVMLLGRDGGLEVAAASTSRLRALELLEMQRRQGPCYEAYLTAEQVTVPDLDTTAGRWPDLVPRARNMGLHAVAAFPLRLRDTTIGALNIFRASSGAFVVDDVELAQAFADMATIGILQERTVSDAEQHAARLQHALTSRIVIEQAKGILAERHELDPPAAFEALRGWARSHNRRLSEVAQQIVAGEDLDLFAS